MYLWRKLASLHWRNANEERLRTVVGDRLVSIDRPNRKRTMFEAAFEKRDAAATMQSEFGGEVVALPRDWLQRFHQGQPAKPLAIGNRLLVFSGSARSIRGKKGHLNIPAGAA